MPDESWVSPEQMKRERAKARELRQSQWWKQQIGPGRCHHCGGQFPKTQLTMDHLIPIARGGKSTKSNVVPACRPCNQSRGHVLDVERTLASMEAAVESSNESPEKLPEESLGGLKSPSTDEGSDET